MGAVERNKLCTHFLPRVTLRDITTRMGPRVLGCLVIVVLCYVARCSCKIAHQTGANEVQQERRKIVKLLLRNFPLQESSSYQNLVEEEDGEHTIVKDEEKEHNLLEDDEEEHPQFQEGDHLAQYAPSYPYEEPSIEDKMYYRPSLKSSDKSEFSRFEHALSPFLLPPPIDSGRVDVDTTVEATEDNADTYYQGYTYPNSYPNIGQIIEEAEEDNADLYYEAYVHPNPNVQIIESLEPTEDNAENYYEGYVHPSNNMNIRKAFEEPTEENADQYYQRYIYPTHNMQLIKSLEEPMEDNIDTYYVGYIQPTPNLKFIKSFEDPTEDNANEYYEAHVQPNTEDNSDEYYEPYLYTSSNLPYNLYTQTQQEWEKLPELGYGNMYEGPMEASEYMDNKELRNGEYENEILDVPRIIVKLEN